ncbi:mannitol-1-phosphate 5-dehydrogenase [Oenococcus oeni]|uniref:mannitol-1-phosphate 5-dehydrogenase n=2 Tax=Oenococcus oeni TaxID=1247 RepID=UPI0008F854D3|nr:mannitol-1-phosphate 5-dehydrogenase [Oenococcus oeni]OIK99929.1 mannitol-1-phosphate 5-dehydrogenase [Oenococcus oeni]PDH77527.1 mannitol-1-phosphate 5-dehydrogenase [Oenococcus oeni]PDH89325.1 mannitol-1-phosphate 5-dehydrogenase [Oenococcus oeni]PDH89575.1 mannitol-1-phosphate 5-dehydrogenase [Oenococcus oeni]PDH91501.1 mannitol-1-phosphate 5-dehydrogenase [Oenococcus oeni]
MKAVHFGAGNIGRGFIGETLAENGFNITFVDVNKTLIDQLNKRGGYTIELAAKEHKQIEIHNVKGINNAKNPNVVSEEISKADMVTTAIGPKILNIIAPLIADGIKLRHSIGNITPIDVIACENMIGGSQSLKESVYESLNGEEQKWADRYIGFPNAAVDRIVPMQKHDDPLFVSVEPFKEWVIDKSQMKRPEIHLEGVEYADDLEPYIERKLFSVNTGHATAAYTGNMKGYKTIGEAIKDKAVVDQVKSVLSETGDLLIQKWHFDPQVHSVYQKKILSRFENPFISDDIERVGRTPIRKLGFNERFVRPIRELKEFDSDYKALVDTVGMVFFFDFPKDSESVKLRQMLKDESIEQVIKETTQLKDEDLIGEIKDAYKQHESVLKN